MERTVTNSSWIKTWENAYSISLPTLKQLKKRLKELETWDKPLGKPSTCKDGRWREWACKKIALKGLILERSNPA